MALIDSVPITEARKNIAELISKAEGGKSTLIVRNSKPAAGLVPASIIGMLPAIMTVLRELGQTELMSHDKSIIEAVRKAEEELQRGDITWY